jgi:uncharacterized membrane protein YesL
MVEQPLTSFSYVRLTAQQLWDELALLSLAAILVSLCAVPALLLFILGYAMLAIPVAFITLLPVWLALLALQGSIVEGKIATIGQMFRALPRFSSRAARLALLGLFPYMAALITLPMLNAPEVPGMVWTGLAADGLGLFIWFVLLLYAAPLIVLYDLDIRTALRNSLLLAARYPVNSIGLLAMATLMVLAIIYIHNGLIIFLPTAWSLFVLNNCRLVVILEENRIHTQEGQSGIAASPTSTSSPCTAKGARR